MLQNEYSNEELNQAASNPMQALRGSDALLYLNARALDLDVSIRAVLEEIIEGIFLK